MKEKQCVLIATDYMHSTVFTHISSCCINLIHICIKFVLISPEVTSSENMRKFARIQCMCECSMMPLMLICWI